MRLSTNNILLKRVKAFLFCLLISGIAVSQKPLPNFTATPVAGCSPLLISFQDQSLNNPTSWSWDFGNGSIGSGPNPTAIYITPGNYTVKLTVTNASGTDSLKRINYITVHPVPNTTFTTNDLLGCFPHTVRFTDTSPPIAGYTNTTYEWNFGDGAISNLQNPTHIYMASGNYNVTLKITNDKGCSKVLNKTSYIKVSSGVVADFTKTAPNVCNPPVNVSFTNTSTGPPGTLNYAWDFGDGTTSFLPNPVHTYNSSGSFNVTLNVTSSLGCSASIVKNNEVVIGSNTTTFTSPASAFVNASVSFTNTSTPAPLSQSWNFGDGTTSVLQNPTKIYTTAGTYLITLTNFYSSCTFTAIKFIVINPITSVNFIVSDTGSCKPPLTVNFQSATIGAVKWFWDLGDGTTSTLQSPVHTYTNYGEYTIKLVTTSSTGFVDSVIKTNYIKIKKATLAIDGIPSQGACLPYVFNPIPTISSLDAIVSYFWNFGDGATSTLKFPTHTYTTQGSYTLTLITTSSKGCTDTLILPSAIRVGTSPVVNFSVSSLTPCAFTTVQFSDLSPKGDEWIWDFGDGGSSTSQNPTYQYIDPGIYTVTLTVKNNGCSNKLIKAAYITVLPPVSKITATPNCSNRNEFTFSDNSTFPLTWFWNFGDGTTSVLQNPLPHNFPTLGDQTVSLTVTNGVCSHNSTITVRTVNENPDFTSSIDTICRGTSATYRVNNINPVNINSYYWDFGDGTQVSTDKDTISHLYSISGTFSVTLITTDINGCEDTASKTNYITVFGPVANFSATNTGGCQGLVTTFNDLTVPDGIHPLVSWKWDFGDSTTQTYNAPPFTHTYSKVGTFSVQLIATDSYGCSDSITVNDLINSTDPNVSFFAKDSVSCPGANIEWDVTATGSGLTYLWKFSDGTTSTDALPIKSFTTTGTYSVKLFITDAFGCTDSTEKVNHIRIDVPVARFSVSDSASSCAPFEVKFTNTSTFSTSQLWTFEPGVTSTLKNPAQYFTTPGLYNVELITTSPGGCTDTAYHTIELFDAAYSRIDYTPLIGCKPQTVSFTAVTSGALSYIWDFGDGESVTTTVPTVTHQYSSFGSFVPKAIIQDRTGCLIPVQGAETITIIGAVARFGLDKNFLCDGGQINFIDSTTYNDPITNYYWDFGDGTISNSQTPSHIYTGAGFYNVMLAVTTQFGCVDTFRISNALKIVAGPDIWINSDTATCLYAPLQFYGNFNVPDTSQVNWFWDFKNGTTSTLRNPATQTFSSSGNFSPVLIATNSSGCADTVTQNIRIHPLPTASMPTDITTLAGNTINIPATYSGNMTNYLWTPSTFLNCTTCPQPDVTPEFNVNYLVVYTDSNNCKNSNTILIKALCNNSNVFVPNTFSPNDDGSNDVFYPRGKGINRAKFFRIFNRWGEIVYERFDFTVNNAIYGWDGTKKGIKANADVYVYQLEVYCQNGDVLSSTGNVTLIR